MPRGTGIPKLSEVLPSRYPPGEHKRIQDVVGLSGVITGWEFGEDINGRFVCFTFETENDSHSVLTWSGPIVDILSKIPQDQPVAVSITRGGAGSRRYYTLSDPE